MITELDNKVQKEIEAIFDREKETINKNLPSRKYKRKRMRLKVCKFFSFN